MTAILPIVDGESDSVGTEWSVSYSADTGNDGSAANGMIGEVLIILDGEKLEVPWVATSVAGD